MLRVDFVTLFPDLIQSPLGQSIMKRSTEKELVRFCIVNPRDFATDPHRTVDDTPYGGGPGMLLSAGPLSKAIDSLEPDAETAIVLTEPTGKPFRQLDAHELAQRPRVVFVCGHYEGIDHRIMQKYGTHAYSIGDYVLTGGELPALVMADAIVRLVPGVIGSERSLSIDSHSDNLLSAPQYTRPEEFAGMRVPEVLLSGDHKAIANWKRTNSLKLTRELRPDLFCSAPIDKRDLNLLLS